MPVTVGNVTLFMGPQTLGGPDNLEAAIIDFIEGAQDSLRISVQELDHRPFAEAIIAAKRRGVSVHMILEQDYLKEKREPKAGKTAPLDENRTLLMEILRVGIDAKADYNPSIFHQKFVVRDAKSVLTGSTNFTTFGVTKNLNHVAVIHDVKVAKEYSKEFAQLRKGIFGARSMAHGRRPLEGHYVSDVRTKPLFAPDHIPELEFLKQMNKARTRIDFAIFTFAQSSGIDDGLANAKRLGLGVKGLLDRKAANQKWAAKPTLADAGVTLFTNKTGTGVGKIHHKLMTIDDQLTIIGSFNYTGPANLTNDENIIVLGDLDETDPAKRDAQAQLALYARNEIERIVRDLAEPLV
jgi:phosphatidylserine/phosphatidylglycerophosphate/cardiolipin synthase-like enzyme